MKKKDAVFFLDTKMRVGGVLGASVAVVSVRAAVWSESGARRSAGGVFEYYATARVFITYLYH